MHALQGEDPECVSVNFMTRSPSSDQWISLFSPRTEQGCHDGDPAPPDYREADLDLVAWMADDASELGNAAS